MHYNYKHVIPFYSWKLLIVRLSQTAQSKISTEAHTILEEDDQRILLLEKVTDPEGGNQNEYHVQCKILSKATKHSKLVSLDVCHASA